MEYAEINYHCVSRRKLSPVESNFGPKRTTNQVMNVIMFDCTKRDVVRLITPILFMISLSISGCTSYSAKNSVDKYLNLPSNLSGVWDFQVENLTGEPLFNAQLRFTTVAAASCISGSNWNEIEVLSVNVVADEKFEEDDILSYHIVDNNLVIGRNLRCDSYLRFAGDLVQGSASGKYYIFGLNTGEDLGRFTLTLLQTK